MNNAKSHRRRGFTLVELMTVIAIIVLLISVLIPALSAVRRQAKNSATAGLIKAVRRRLLRMFQGEFKSYPQSRGENPFEDDSSILQMGFPVARSATGRSRQPRYRELEGCPQRHQ